MEKYMYWDSAVIIPRPKMDSPQSPNSPKTGNKFLTTLRNSPSLLRKKFMHSDSDLSGGDASKERCFHVQYRGRVPVKSLRVQDAVVAVEKVTPVYSSSAPPINASCSIRIDKSTITFEDSSCDVLESLPLFCIAYCATDVRLPRAVALTCKTRSDAVHCHVFETTTKDKASEIVAYITRAFEAAWADWKRSHPDEDVTMETQKKHCPPGHVPL